MTEHELASLSARTGWAMAVCECGWQGPPCPDKVTAANFWGQHLQVAMKASTR